MVHRIDDFFVILSHLMTSTKEHHHHPVLYTRNNVDIFSVIGRPARGRKARGGLDAQGCSLTVSPRMQIDTIKSH
jgi:hypothetical protein